MKRKTWKRYLSLAAVMMAAGTLAACGNDPGAEVPEAAEEAESTASEVEQTEEAVKDPTLLYMGHASIRIVTGEDKVIYIDPYVGEGYDLPADMILVTHGHYDHNGLDLIKSRNDDCRVITQNEALQEGSFDAGYVRVEAVEAGNNENHDVSECVGYVLTFTNGRKVYISGDTSTTDQMAELAEENIDYAFFCCDGVYNMDLEEAARCAELVKAKHNIPYHIVPAEDENHFSVERAKRFAAPDKMIIRPGEELVIQ